MLRILRQSKSIIDRYIRPYFSLTTLGVIFWAALTLKLLSIVLMLIVNLSRTSDDNGAQALDLGQRAIVHLATGEVEGNARSTKQMNIGWNDPAESSANKDNKDRLPPAPLFSLTEQSSKGALPIAGHDGTLPWHYYARPFPEQEKRPLVAIILTNIGLSADLTKDVMKLPHNFTLSISPYAGDAKMWGKRLRDEGFESLVDLPMESDDFPDNEGEHYSLLTSVTANENSTRLHWVLSRFPGFVGTLAPLHENMTANSAVLRPILAELGNRGVLFFYLKTSANAGVADMTKTQGLKTLGIDKVIDDDMSPMAIRQQLKDLTDLAKTQGYAIGIAHSYPPTLDALNEWAGSLDTQNVALAPVSAIARKIYP